MRFGALSFSQRFGEVRSALQQAPSQQGFERLVWMLTCMHKQDAARFEIEVLPYSRDGLERWYAACPLGLDGVGELVCAGARGDRWRVVGRAPRGERVARAPRGEVWSALARSVCVTVNKREEERLAGARLERLERLCLIPKLYSEYELSAALCAPWLEQLTGLEARGLMLGEEIASWSGRDLGRLEALDLTGGCVRPWQLGAVGALEGLRMVGLPYGPRIYPLHRHYNNMWWRHGRSRQVSDWSRAEELEGDLVGLIEGARWRAVEVLSGELWTEAVTRAVAARGWPVREVRLSWSAQAGSGSWDELVAWLEGGGAPRLRALRVWAVGGRQEALGPVWTKLARFAGERGVRLENLEFRV